jgi:hypothetical protein
MVLAVVLTAACPLSTALISSGVPSFRTALALRTVLSATLSIAAAQGVLMETGKFAGG